MLTRQWMCGTRPWVDWLGLPISLEVIVVLAVATQLLWGRGLDEWASLTKKLWISLGVAWVALLTLATAGAFATRISHINPTIVFEWALRFRALTAFPLVGCVIFLHLRESRQEARERSEQPNPRITLTRPRPEVRSSGYGWAVVGVVLLCFWHLNFAVFRIPRNFLNWVSDYQMGLLVSTDTCLAERILEHGNIEEAPSTSFKLRDVPSWRASSELSQRSGWLRASGDDIARWKIRAAILDAVREYPHNVAAGRFREPESFDGLRRLYSRPDKQPYVMDALRRIATDDRLKRQTRALAQQELEYWKNWKPPPTGAAGTARQ